MTDSPRERDDLISRKEAIEALLARTNIWKDPHAVVSTVGAEMDRAINILAVVPPSQPPPELSEILDWVADTTDAVPWQCQELGNRIRRYAQSLAPSQPPQPDERIETALNWLRGNGFDETYQGMKGNTMPNGKKVADKMFEILASLPSPVQGDGE